MREANAQRLALGAVAAVLVTATVVAGVRLLPFSRTAVSFQAYPVRVALSQKIIIDLSDPIAPASNGSGSAIDETAPAASDTPAAGGAGLTLPGAPPPIAATGAAMAMAAVQRPPVAPAPPRSGAFLVSDFDLAAGASSSKSVQLSKPVWLNGRSAGTVELRIGSASEVYVRRDDIAGLLDGKVPLPQGDGGFVTLDQLRDRGLDIRYNASRDVLAITQ